MIHAIPFGGLMIHKSVLNFIRLFSNSTFDNMNRSVKIMLRNWLTFKLRGQLMILRRKLNKSFRCASLDNSKAKFNQSMTLEIKHLFRYQEEGNLPIFDKVITQNLGQ